MVEYYPRLSKNDPVPIKNNPYWYSNYNPFWATGVWYLPNCTCYAWGRWGEISGGETLNLPRLDGGDWFPKAQQDGYYETGYTAQLGAVICWSKAGEMGHVAIVEEILPDGSIITSNSGYYRGPEGTPEYEDHYFWTERQPPDYSKYGYVFQGFIYNPYSPVPPPKPVSKKLLLFSGINRRKRNDIGKSKFGNSIWNGKHI